MVLAMNDEPKCAVSLGKGEVDSSILSGSTSFPAISGESPAAEFTENHRNERATATSLSDKSVKPADLPKRLFVPLARQPFEWFESRDKGWEVRRAKGAYRPDRLAIGRPVLLRLGYSGSRELHGAIAEVHESDCLVTLLSSIWERTIPYAAHLLHATEIARGILGPKPGPFVAFRVDVPLPSRKHRSD